MAPPHNPTSGEVLPFGKVIDKRELDAIYGERPNPFSTWAESLQMEPRAPTLRDDAMDFWLAIKADIHFALVMVGLGFVAGLAVTVGLASLISVFL